ncbi:6002_t:CDS:2 [Ambispora gerdemannii]|uniref:6002_t:CDS:1 n=1 Tax=Ambispora gerdemannii TaxID=144530 RepID=A0A9N8YNH8_9GLOM|nr:6002_t:CDS:2 [Ambispora gerdemannii]
MGNCVNKPKESVTDSDPCSIAAPLTETCNKQRQQHQQNSLVCSINDRSSKLHSLFKDTWQENFLAPVHDQLNRGNARVLDLRCQTGEWVLDVSDKYPLAKIWGIDTITSNFFPSQKPLNCNFLHLDILNGLPFADNTFDLVHTRCLIFTLTEIEWEQKVIKELSRVLKPGTGWLSLLEINLLYTNEGPDTAKLTEYTKLFLKEKKMNPDIASLQANLLRASNKFTNIQVHERFPTSEHANNISAGEFALTMYDLGKELSNFIGLNDAEYQSLVESSVKEFNIYKTSVRQTRVIARRILN